MGRFTKEYIVLLANNLNDFYVGKGRNKDPNKKEKKKEGPFARVPYDNISFSGKKTPLKNQVGGKHYKEYAIQPIEFITANKLDFIEGCIIKYICRYAGKNGSEDLRKIKHYVDLLLWFRYKETDIDKPMNREEIYAKIVDDAGIADKGGRNEDTQKS